MERAAHMDAEEIRRVFPRFFGECTSCGETVTIYASAAQYIGGDW